MKQLTLTLLLSAILSTAFSQGKDTTEAKREKIIDRIMALADSIKVDNPAASSIMYFLASTMYLGEEEYLLKKTYLTVTEIRERVRKSLGIAPEPKKQKQ